MNLGVQVRDSFVHRHGRDELVVVDEIYIMETVCSSEELCKRDIYSILYYVRS